MVASFTAQVLTEVTVSFVFSSHRCRALWKKNRSIPTHPPITSATHPPIHPRSSPCWRALGESVTNQADFHLLQKSRGDGKDENLHLTSSWPVPLYITLLPRKSGVIWLACFSEKHIETLYVLGVYSRHGVLSYTSFVSTHVSFGDVLER